MRRNWKVAELAARGLTNKEIAEQLVSPGPSGPHLHPIVPSLDV